MPRVDPRLAPPPPVRPPHGSAAPPPHLTAIRNTSDIGDRPTLIVTQGLPAAGKTTAARKLIANSPRPVRYVGLDALRLMLDGQSPTAWWADGVEELTARAQAALVRQLLADGADVLLDGTHVKPGQVAALRSAITGLPVEVRVLRLDTAADVCVARDAVRPHPIGEACIRRLAGEWAAAEAGGWRLTPEWLTGGPQSVAPPSGRLRAPRGAP